MNSEIERLAKEAGFSYFDRISPDLRSMDPRYAKFAALLAEECANVVIALEHDHVSGNNPDDECTYANCDFTAAWQDAVAAIRAKFALSHKTPEAK